MDPTTLIPSSVRQFKKLALTAAVAILLTACGTTTSSTSKSKTSSYPNQSIKIIVSFPAGSTSDIQARTIASQLGKLLHTGVVVQDIPGGNTAPALAALEAAPANGYTLLFTTPGVEYGIAQGSTPYKASSIQFVAQMDTQPAGLWVLASSPYHTFAQLVSYARSHPGVVSITGPGAFSPNSRFVSELEKEEHIRVTYVPDQGGTDAVKYVLDGQSIAGTTSIANAMSYLAPGKYQLRVLLVSSPTKYPYLPNAPTSSTLHISSRVNWFGFVEKAGTPAGITEKLDAALQKIDASKTWMHLITKMEVTNAFMTGKAFESFASHQLIGVQHYADESKT